MTRCSIVIVSALLLAGCSSSQPGATTRPVSMGAVNDTCPLSGEPVDPGAPTATYEGLTVGFCCPACVDGWKKRSDAEKAAFVAQYR